MLTLTDEELDRLDVTHPELKDVSPYDYCPTCKKSGHYTWRGDEWSCNCVRQVNLLKKYSSCGVGRPYQTVDWDDWDQDQDLLRAAKKYAFDPDYIQDGTGLFFWGDIGTGKTMLAMLVLKELIKQGYQCYATTFDDTVEAFTAGWRSDEDKRWFEKTFKFSQVVLLDDVGKEYWGKTGLSKTLFGNLLRARVNAGRPTIITTNMTPDEITAGYGAGTMDLIIAQSLKCHFAGASYRSKLSERRALEKERGERRPIV